MFYFVHSLVVGSLACVQMSSVKCKKGNGWKEGIKIAIKYEVLVRCRRVEGLEHFRAFICMFRRGAMF